MRQHRGVLLRRLRGRHLRHRLSPPRPGVLGLERLLRGHRLHGRLLRPLPHQRGVVRDLRRVLRGPLLPVARVHRVPTGHLLLHGQQPVLLGPVQRRRVRPGCVHRDGRRMRRVDLLLLRHVLRVDLPRAHVPTGGRALRRRHGLLRGRLHRRHLRRTQVPRRGPVLHDLLGLLLLRVRHGGLPSDVLSLDRHELLDHRRLLLRELPRQHLPTGVVAAAGPHSMPGAIAVLSGRRGDGWYRSRA